MAEDNCSVAGKLGEMLCETLKLARDGKYREAHLNVPETVRLFMVVLEIHGNPDKIDGTEEARFRTSVEDGISREYAKYSRGEPR